MSDSDNIPSDVEEAAQAAIATLLPTKSKHLYEATYEKFNKWCMQKNIKELNEKVALAYFAAQVKDYKPSTTWCIFSKLRATINMKQNIDIGKYANLIAFIKRKSEGYKPKKSKIFTKSEIDRFLVEADDNANLLMKVALIVGVAGACRREELAKMCMQDIEDLGECIKINVPDSKTKISRQFIITEGKCNGVNMLDLIRKYSKLRKENTAHSRFFLGYRAGKCTVQPVGINTFGSMPKRIAKYLKLLSRKNRTCRKHAAFNAM